MQLLNSLLLLEERKKNLTYVEQRDKKNNLEKVILELQGTDSAAASRLAKRYMRLDATAKAIAKKRDELNQAVKNIGDDIFDAEDVLVTRVINTISFTLMLTASQKGADKPEKKSTDYEAAFKALSALVPELEEQAKAIQEKYTEVVKQKDTPTMLKVQPRLKEGLGDTLKGWIRMVKAAGNTLLKNITRWARGYDAKLDALKREFSPR